MFPSISAYDFPASGGGLTYKTCVLAYIYWLTSLLQTLTTSRKCCFVNVFSLLFIYAFFPPLIIMNTKIRQCPGFGTDICMQTTWQSTQKKRRESGLDICLQKAVYQLSEKSTNLLVSNLAHKVLTPPQNGFKTNEKFNILQVSICTVCGGKVLQDLRHDIFM